MQQVHTRALLAEPPNAACHIAGSGGLGFLQVPPDTTSRTTHGTSTTG